MHERKHVASVFLRYKKCLLIPRNSVGTGVWLVLAFWALTFGRDSWQEMLFLMKLATLGSQT
jgi:hypothetical protein